MKHAEKDRLFKQSRLTQCAEYLIESEWDDFENYVLEGNDPLDHIFYTAFVAINGTDEFQKLVNSIREDEK